MSTLQITPTRVPTRFSTAIFLGKATLLQIRRMVEDLAHSIQRHPQSYDARFTQELSHSATRLWTDTNPSESWYQRGKIQNLRVAASRLHLCVIPAGEVFSFWQQVGRASSYHGYVPGRMLQEGCMIPAIGGGLCQLSNALYQVALDTGCTILERHPHSRVVPGSATSAGRDATVAWNYIDFRFRSEQTLQLRVVLSATELHVSLHAALAPANNAVQLPATPVRALEIPAIFNDHACESCGNTTCFRHEHATVHLGKRATAAFLLDAAWPEFRRYVAEHHSGDDVLAIPLDGHRWNKAQYGWPTEGFGRVSTATVTTLMQAARHRHLPAQGASRQSLLLERAEAVARHLAKSLTSEIDEVCVSQSLLPFLWRLGVLGGRRFRVLMSQLPANVLQSTLNLALQQHPGSTTLGDFRADASLLDAEQEALDAAEMILTPHAYIASLFPAKATLLDWATPASKLEATQQVPRSGPTIFFPASTLGRKGAYELREALRGLDVKLLLGGPILEAEDFWDGLNAERVQNEIYLEADAVVLPTIVESQPRSLLRALGAGQTVITTRESGLHLECGARFVPVLDTDALQNAIRHALDEASFRFERIL